MTFGSARRRWLAPAVLALLTVVAIAIWVSAIRDHGSIAALFLAGALTAAAAYYAITRWTPITARVLDLALLVIGNIALIPLWLILGPRPLVYAFTVIQLINNAFAVHAWYKNRRGHTNVQERA